MRLMLTALVVSGLSMLSFAQEQKRLEIVFGGGYAFVVEKDGKSLTVGPVQRPHILATHYMTHDLKLSVSNGYIDPDLTTILPENIGHDDGSPLGWDLSGRSIQVLIDGKPLPSEKVVLPPPGNPLPCSEENRDVNNRRHIPVVTEIADDKGMERDWFDRLDGQLVLTGGQLAVKTLATGCFRFSKSDQERRLVSGNGGLEYSRPLTTGNEIVTFRVWKEGKIDDENDPKSKIGDIVVVPKGGLLTMVLHARHPGLTPQDKPIKHFKHYYWMIEKDVPEHRRQIPTWLGSMIAGERTNAVADEPMTPGEACPPVLYDLQP